MQDLQRHFETLESYLPFRLSDPYYFLVATLTLTAIVAFRYFLMVGLAWSVLYQMKPRAWKSRQIYSELPSCAIQKFEIKWSLVNAALFGLSGVVLGLMWQAGWTRIYLQFDTFGLWYLPVSLLFMSVLHELYFYATHRALHWPMFYRRFHSVHHKSLEPSPWASFCFHPVEGLVQAAALPLIVLVIPVHPTMLLLYLTVMTISAIINHLGFEVLPRNRLGLWLGHWLITGTHHAGHHKTFRNNYGLFFTFCDRVFKTEDKHFATQLSLNLSRAEQ